MINNPLAKGAIIRAGKNSVIFFMNLKMINFVCMPDHRNICWRSCSTKACQVPEYNQTISISSEHTFTLQSKAEHPISKFIILRLERNLIERILTTVVDGLSCFLFDVVKFVFSRFRYIDCSNLSFCFIEPPN